MKTFLLVLFVVIISNTNIFAQTASDFYLIPRAGNYSRLHTTGNLGSAWAQRTTTYSFEGSDSIFGKKYFKEKGWEQMDETNEIHIFRVFWLRKDSVGNVALGAMNTTNGSLDIDSAMVMDVRNWYPNEYLSSGFSRSYSNGETIMQDSVCSTTETVTVSGGTFSNCLKLSEIHYNKANAISFLEYHYYAKGVGLVKNVRTLPDSEAHTDELVQYHNVTSAEEQRAEIFPETFSLSQNYPNPFNPTTNFSFTLPMATYVSLKIYDALGREVATLVSEEMSVGSFTKQWNAERIAGGVYFYRLHAGSYSETKRLVLLK